ncbi:MAG: FAD-dependent oxidoreductase [Firmicutes bacterium]|nr:FAD-dependent oxidoreductase [Bacillota bacterium]
MDCVRADVSVVGGGLAGLSAALAARQSGVSVLVLSDPGGPPASDKSGGVFRTAVPGYPEERHFIETITHGSYLSQRPLARALAEDSSRLRAFLSDLGVALREVPHGLSVAGGGGEVRRSLDQAVRAAGAEVVPAVGWDVLLAPDGAVAGLLAYDPSRAAWVLVETRSVVVASGGATGAYRWTDDSPEATGDGLALAFRAGAVLAGMEFTAFWPVTRISGPASPTSWVPPSELARSRLLAGDRDVTEAVGLGGLADGAAAPTAVARRIYGEARLGDEGSELPLRLVAPSGESFPVTPAAHITLGGVVCGDHGQTRVPGLYVAGQVATGVHGADWLPGNGLTEAVTLGRRAGLLAAAMLRRSSGETGLSGSELEQLARARVGKTLALLEATGSAALRPAEMMARVREAMWRFTALIRTRESLDAAQSVLNRMKRQLPLAVQTADGLEVRAGLKALNLLLVAEAMTRSARFRRESRGVHFRADHPTRDDGEWLRHVRARLFAGEMSLDISGSLDLMEP